jgi:hypothetical protein
MTRGAIQWAITLTQTVRINDLESLTAADAAVGINPTARCEWRGLNHLITGDFCHWLLPVHEGSDCSMTQ